MEQITSGNMFGFISFLGLAILALDSWAILDLAQSNVCIIAAVIWIVLIIMLPLLVFGLCWLAGPRRAG